MAGPTKQECKVFAGDVKTLGKELGVSPEITGRALMSQVESWIAEQDPATIEQTITRIEQATDGVQQCEAGGMSRQVLPIKGISVKLQTATLAWLRNATSSDACQSLINDAFRKKADDLDGAIADLERSVRECEDESWLAEAHQNLAALYYQRGDAGKDDYARGREQTRQAYKLSESREAGERKILLAILAKPTIEAGKKQMEQAEYEQVVQHWKGYMEIFGTSSFDVLFSVQKVAQGTASWRGLLDARYQLALACLELGDTACVEKELLPAMPEYQDDLDPVADLISRLFDPAADGEGSDENYVLAFDLLTAWQEIDPDSYKMKRLIQQKVVSREHDERLELLRLTDKCWIPLHVANGLRQEDQPYLDELEVAAACGESGELAQSMLTEVHLKAVHARLDRLGAARTAQEKRALLNEVEQQMLPKLGNSAEAEQIRRRLAQERARIQEVLAQAVQEDSNRYFGCTGLLATIQWNKAREEDYEEHEVDFKRGCCRFLVANTNGWDKWMRTRPEQTRLANEEIENKKKLMGRYCAP